MDKWESSGRCLLGEAMIDGENVTPKDDTSFGAELGRTFTGFAFVAIFFAIAGGLLWLLLK